MWIKRKLAGAGALLLVSCGFLLASNVQAATKAKESHACFNGKNRICQQIVELRPTIDRDMALKLSSIFRRASVDNGIPAELLISIAKQESDFRPSLVRTVDGFVKATDGYEERAVGSDFCMMQINAVNIKRFNWDVNELLTDPTACVKAAVVILKSAQRFKGKEPTWWTRYNAGTQKNRNIYAKSVLKHWRLLDPAVDGGVCQLKV